ncbi:hypothetical protein D0809_13935, partial [Flavobacterium circumlabens]
YCSYVGEYVVAFLFKILIMYLMGIFLFYIESWNLTAKPAKEFLNGIKAQGTQGWRDSFGNKISNYP